MGARASGHDARGGNHWCSLTSTPSSAWSLRISLGLLPSNLRPSGEMNSIPRGRDGQGPPPRTEETPACRRRSYPNPVARMRPVPGTKARMGRRRALQHLTGRVEGASGKRRDAAAALDISLEAAVDPLLTLAGSVPFCRVTPSRSTSRVREKSHLALLDIEEAAEARQCRSLACLSKVGFGQTMQRHASCRGLGGESRSGLSSCRHLAPCEKTPWTVDGRTLPVSVGAGLARPPAVLPGCTRSPSSRVRPPTPPESSRDGNARLAPKGVFVSWEYIAGRAHFDSLRSPLFPPTPVMRAPPQGEPELVTKPRRGELSRDGTGASGLLPPGMSRCATSASLRRWMGGSSRLPAGARYQPLPSTLQHEQRPLPDRFPQMTRRVPP